MKDQHELNSEVGGATDEEEIRGRHDGEHSNQGRDEVTITINSEDKQIHRGRQSVADIKDAGDVPLAHELEQVVNGILTPLDDNGAVTIKGGEHFVSHPKTGASS